MDIDSIIKALTPLERKVIPYLKNNVSIQGLQDLTNLQEVEVIRALQWLEIKKAVKINIDHKNQIKLNKNGLLYLEKEMPERRLLKLSKSKALTIDDLRKSSEFEPEELNIAIGFLKSRNAITIENKNIKITKKGLDFLNL